MIKRKGSDIYSRSQRNLQTITRVSLKTLVVLSSWEQILLKWDRKGKLWRQRNF